MTADPSVVRAFVGRVGAAVVKPVDGFAGIDVWLLRDDDAATRRWPSPPPAAAPGT